MTRGEVVLVSFPFSSGAGAKVRPALVVQTDRNNRRLPSTIVAMISSTTARAGTEPTQLLVDPHSPEGGSSGLLHPSAVKCENLFTIDQGLILRTIGALSSSLMIRIDACLKAALELR